jgi:Protein of unknown function (DUF3300)
MKRIHATLGLALFAILSLMLGKATFAQDPPPDNVEGNWTIYATNHDTGLTEIKHVQIAQYGNQLTGYFEGPHQAGPIQGEVKGHHIHFSTVTRTVLNFRGQIYGSNMSGECGVHGKHAPWQAVRTSGGPVVVQPVEPPAVSYTQPILIPQSVQSAPTYTAPAPAYTPTYAPQPAPGYPAQNYSAPAAAPPSYSASAPAPAYAPSYAQQPAPQPTGTAAPGSAPTPAPLSSDQLNSLVAPIALYPDALVAQVLAAAANPDQVAYADDWLAQNRNLTGAALGQAVDQQSWDPSVKALIQFPSVLDNLAHNLSWTSSLGQAFANQQADVMAAVQAMRAKAQAAGTLQSSSQITVTQPSSGVIVIQPANPQVVYVPQYNPAVVYGAPVVVPLYVPPPVPVASVGLYFGSGITIGAVFGGGGWGGGFGWGWHAWNVNWGAGGWGGGGGSTIIFNHNTYINNHTWNNTNYNGYHPWGPGSRPGGYVGPNGAYHPDPGYHPGTDTHYGPNGGYHPNGYFGPNGGWHPDSHTNTANQPNGGNNGNHGLIGGNGGVRNPSAGMNGPGVAPNGGYHNDTENHSFAGGNSSARSDENNFKRSRMSGDGGMNRMESNRGRDSMAGRHSQPHMAREHAPAEHHSGGGGGRRR